MSFFFIIYYNVEPLLPVIATPNDISYKEASIGIVGFLHLTVFIFLLNLYQFLILCSSNALLLVKLYFPPF